MDKDMVTCPYNKSHRLLRSRIQAHLLKCEKIYPPLEICAYNHSHRVPKSELNNHIANCPSKVVKVVDLDAKHGLIYHPMPNPQHSFKPTDPEYECWD